MPFLTQGKTNWKFLLIVIILAIIVGGGALWYVKRPEKPYQPVEIKKPEISQNLTPKEVIKTWFENQKKGDWQSVFANMVDVDGKPYSQECQDGFKKAFGANVGADYTLDVKNDLKTGTCKDLPELNLLAQSFGFQLPDGQCAIVSISYSTKSSGSVDTFSTLFKVNNDWKVMMYCKPLLSAPPQGTPSGEEVVSKGKFILKIELPKTVKVGEPFKGSYIVENGGEILNYLQVAICRKEGESRVEESFKTIGKFYPDQPGRTEKYYLYPCFPTSVAFLNPGNYTFDIRFYDCSEIEKVLKVPCSIKISYADYNKVQPFITAERSVTVTE